MENKFFAIYKDHNDVLVFDTKDERDTYVEEEKVVHPDCACTTYEKIKDIVCGRSPVYDSGFGCMTILS